MNATSPTPIGTALADLAAEEPDRPAVTCDDETLTRAELDQASNRLARAYADVGIGIGDYVSIGAPNSVAFVAAVIATWKLGAIPQLVAAGLPAAELAAILDLVKPAGLVGLPDPTGTFPTLPLTDRTHDDSPLPPCTPPRWKAPTSGGSTGRPKIIVATGPGIAEALLPFARLARMPTSSTVYVPGPLHHNGPFMFGMVGALAGNHVVLSRRFDATRALAAIATHRAEWAYAVPTMMHRIQRLPPDVRDAYDISSLRHLVHMAAPCPAWLKRAWIDRLGPEAVLEVYAGTEAQAATIITGAEWLAHPGSVGRAAYGQIAVLDAEGNPVPAGTVDRIWLRSGPDATPPYEYIGAEPTTLPGGWESLGDLGYLDDDGYLYLTDRDTDMIVVGGSNVYPAEIEAALDAHPAVLSSCVVGLPHIDLGQAPHAIIQAQTGLDYDELTAFLRSRLSAYKLPRSFEVVDHPLRDDAGKVRRSALRQARSGPRAALSEGQVHAHHTPG